MNVSFDHPYVVPFLADEEHDDEDPEDYDDVQTGWTKDGVRIARSTTTDTTECEVNKLNTTNNVETWQIQELSFQSWLAIY